MNKRAPLILAFTLVGVLIGLVLSRSPLVVGILAFAGAGVGAFLPTGKLAAAGPQLGFLDYAW